MDAAWAGLVVRVSPPKSANIKDTIVINPKSLICFLDNLFPSMESSQDPQNAISLQDLYKRTFAQLHIAILLEIRF